MKRWWTGVLALALVVAGSGAARGEEPSRPSIAALKATVEDESKSRREREDAAEAIAEKHYDPDSLVPWLTGRLAVETSFPVRLALAYALAAQGEVEGLKVLVQALERTGHLGCVYLTRVSEKRFDGPDVGWNKPAWDAWLAGLDPKAWRDLQRQKHLPRKPLDDDLAGLEKAAAWWDGLGYPDVRSLPFGRVVRGWGQSGSRIRETWEFGFLVREDAASFTVFGTDLSESTYPRAPGGGQQARFERVAIEEDVGSELAAVKRGNRREFRAMERDTFGVDFYLTPRRSQGFVLARALLARGGGDLAVRVWKHVAAYAPWEPRYGPWSALDLVREDCARRARQVWEERLPDVERTWAENLADFRVWRKRFDAEGRAAKAEAVLARMAEEEPRYAAAAASDAKDPEERARALVLALPTVARGLARDWDSSPRSGGWWDGDPKVDALSRLVDLGFQAVPTLLQALVDHRFTRSQAWVYGDSKAYIRNDPEPVSVRELAVVALREIAQRDFPPGGAEDRWAEVAAQVDAWWKAVKTEGERPVLERGVLARTDSSVAQAKRLVERYPEAALDPIRKASDGAEPRLAAGLVKALAPLARADVHEFLLGLAKAGPLEVRMAAAETLHAQGRGEGVDILLAEWPAVAEAKGPDDGAGWYESGAAEGLVALLFRLEPWKSLRRVRETLAQAAPTTRDAILAKVHEALGHRMFFSPGRPADSPRSPEVWKEAETLVVSMVLEEITEKENLFTDARRGEEAAVRAAEFWPHRYAFDAKAPARERLLARFAIVNAWRAGAGLPPLRPPPAISVEALPPKIARPLIDAWLAADDAARPLAEAAILAAGLPILPRLASARDALPDASPRREALDRVVRRVAMIVREVVWSPSGPRPNASLTAYVDAIRGKPVTGRWITGLWRQVAIDTPEGATGIDLMLTRLGDGTGVVLVLELPTETYAWRGGSGGWILAGDGLEHVDGDFLRAANSWWHEARAPQTEEEWEGPETKEVHVRRTLTKAEG